MNTSIVHTPSAFAPPPAQRQPENPLLLLHRYLRGRYLIAVVLGALLAVPGGIVGYKLTQPTYSSTGIIRVAPTLPRLMFQNEDNQVPPMFDSFVATQASMLGSRRVLDLAVQDKALRDAGWPSGGQGAARLKSALRIGSQRGSELIMAEVEHQDPRLAQIAVNAVLAAYDSVHDEMTGMSATEREQALRARQRELQREIDGLRIRIADYARPWGTDDLNQLHTAKVADTTRLDNIITDLEIRLPTARRASAASGEGESPAAGEVELEQLALRDRILGMLIEQRIGLLTELDSRAARLGPEHRDMVKLRQRREALDSSINSRVAFLREHGLTLPTRADAAADPNVLTAEQIEEALIRHRQVRARLHAEAGQIGRDRVTIDTFKAQLADRQQALDETSRRLEQIEVENRHVASGRISVLQRGDLPSVPSRDRRRPLAVLGAMAGGGMGVGLVALFGLLRGGYRYIDELERVEGATALLGTVPDLASSDPQHASLAALSVHHLRNMLQRNTTGRPGGGTVFTVSSPTSGDGKTSLALSLGMSFATMGNRTLLVDADLVGCGLTRQLMLKDRPGLCQALRATTLNGEVHETRVGNLWALPVGFTDGMQPEQISQADLHRVLETAREQFDTVIIDTGPILGSLEANLVTPMSDSVVMVVSRGQKATLLRSAMQRLARLGATCGGLVFNRAEVGDFDRSISAASFSGRSVRDRASAEMSSPGAAALLEAVSTNSRESNKYQS